MSLLKPNPGTPSALHALLGGDPLPELEASASGSAPTIPAREPVTANAGGPPTRVEPQHVMAGRVRRTAADPAPGEPRAAEVVSGLKELIAEARRQHGALTEVIRQADLAVGSVVKAEQDQQANLELAARALKGLDQKAASAQKLLEQAVNTAAAFQKFEEHAEGVVTEKLARVEAVLDSGRSQAEARLVAMEGRLSAMAADLSRREQDLAAREAALHRLDAAGAAAEELIARLDSVRERARQEEASLAGSSQTHRAGLELVAQEVTRRAAEAEQRVAQSQTAADALQQRLDAAVRAGGGGLEDLVARAEAAATRLDQGVGKAGEANHTTALGLRVVESSMSQVRQLLTVLEPWQRVLLTRPAPGQKIELPEAIRAVIDAARVEVKGELSKIAEALRAVADRTELAASEREAATLPEPTGAAPFPGLEPQVMPAAREFLDRMADRAARVRPD